jgi:tetratricopeptide (TPR) repeat protein
MKQKERGLWLVIVAAGLLVYSNSLWVPFHFDDHGVIVDNPAVNRALPLPPDRGVGDWLHSRMVVDATFQMNYRIHGLNVVGYHVVNILIHIANALLLYGIVRRTLDRRRSTEEAYPQPRDKKQETGTHSSILAFATALLWIVHPLNTSAVTYISQRYESMMALCCLATLYCFIRGVAVERPRWWFNAAVVFCILGMGTKQVMAVTPILVLLYDGLFAAPSWSGVRRRWRVHASLFATWGVLVILEISFLGSLYQRGAYRVASVSPAVYLMTQADVILQYVRLALVPYPLCFDYAWRPVSGLAQVAVPGLLLAAGLAVSVWGLVRRRPWAFAGFAFYLLLAPSSSVMPLDDMAFEHRMYLALAALVWLGVTGAWCVLMAVERRSLDGRGAAGGVGTLLVVLVVAVFAWRTTRRNEIYKTEERLWLSVVEQQPHNLRAWNLVARERSRRGAVEEALTAYNRVLSATESVAAGAPYHHSLPANSMEINRLMAFANRGLLLYQHGRYEAAIASYRSAIMTFPYRRDVFHKLAGAYRATGVSAEEAGRRVSELVERMRTSRLQK